MVADMLYNLPKYMLSKEYCEAIMDFVARFERGELSNQRYDLLGDRLFVVVQRYETKPSAGLRMEAHRVYADVQYIASGSERIFWDAERNIKPDEDRTPNDDIMFFDNRNDSGSVALSAGMFALFLPGEAHMPCVRVKEDEARAMCKLVFKVRWNE